MGDLSKNFSIHEFTCKCGCGFYEPSSELIVLCELVRLLNKSKPVTVTSGCRCMTHNANEGGSQNSKHLKGIAADLKVENPSYVFDKLCDLFPDTYGFGLYNNRVHIDVRKRKARWDNVN